MDEHTTLSDLLSLNLHNFEDEVRGIVDKAVKEMSMEKVLKELDVTWAAMEFEHEKHSRTQITMLKTSEELIETLEDNQVGIYENSKIVSEYDQEIPQSQTADNPWHLFKMATLKKTTKWFSRPVID